MLPDSMNVGILADNIRALQGELAIVKAEIPDHDSGDSGKILAVDASGDLEWKDEYSYTPPAYSTTETATGRKWIDGKDIYCKVYNGDLPIITSGATVSIYQVTGADTIISVHTMILSSTLAYDRFNHLITPDKTIQFRSATEAYSENPYFSIVEYTKSDPVPAQVDKGTGMITGEEPEPEAKKTRKSSK